MGMSSIEEFKGLAKQRREHEERELAKIEVITEEMFRKRVALMRELGVVQWAGIILGPEPRAPTPLEAITKRAEAPDATPEEKRAARIEEAREALRAKLGNWDISNERIDPLLDPGVFE